MEPIAVDPGPEVWSRAVGVVTAITAVAVPGPELVDGDSLSELTREAMDGLTFEELAHLFIAVVFLSAMDRALTARGGDGAFVLQMIGLNAMRRQTGG